MTPEHIGACTLYHGDCLDVLAALPEASVDAVVTDPPYGIGFMGRAWDSPETVAFRADTWRAVMRVLKPGGHMLAFSATRTYHRMAVAIEDAGFEVRDMCAWMFGSGFPKSLDVSKAIDKALGAEREVVGSKAVTRSFKGLEYVGSQNAATTVDQTAPATPEAAEWTGYGSALKPALEPLCLARKPLAETSIARNVLAHGTGALNIDAGRVGTDAERLVRPAVVRNDNAVFGKGLGYGTQTEPPGRWPANVQHDGSPEVLALFPETGKAGTGEVVHTKGIGGEGLTLGGKERSGAMVQTYADSGSAARFFYTAKADAVDRRGSKHPTVKPLDLMAYYVRLITPRGGVVLDPFAGTGTTGEAAVTQGFRAILIEREAEHADDIRRRLRSLDTTAEARRGMSTRKEAAPLPLFDEA